MPGSTAIAPLTPSVAPASAARVVSGRTPTTTSTMSAARVTVEPSAAVAWTSSRPVPAGRGLADGPDGGARQDLHAAGGAARRARGRRARGSTVGSTSGSCSIWVTRSPRTVSASAISRPMYPAPTMTALAGAACSRVRMTAKVSPIECSRCTPSPGPAASGPARPPIGGPDWDRAGADDQLVVAEHLLAAAGGGDQELAAGARRCAGRWCPAAAASRRPRGRRGCGGPGSASGRPRRRRSRGCRRWRSSGRRPAGRP